MSRRGSENVNAGISACTHPLEMKINEVLDRLDDLEEKMSKLIDDKLGLKRISYLSLIKESIRNSLNWKIN